MRTAQDPWDKPRRNPWPIVMACAAIALAIILALTVSALTLNFIFDALLADKPPGDRGHVCPGAHQHPTAHRSG